MSSNTPSGHCSGTNICSKRTPGRSAHLRLASTSGAWSGVDRDHGVAARSKRSGQNADRASHLERRSITRLRHRVQRERIFASLVGTRREIPGIGISRVERVKILRPECLARFAHASLSRKNSYGRSKWARSIWLKRNPPGSSSMRARCLRAVRGNGAALLFHGLAIDADPEPASDRINFSRGWKRMSPDDILEQSDFRRRDAEPHARSDRTPRGRNGDRAAS